MKNNITVISTIYNEEKRIENFIEGLSWCDDILIINKGSTDKTADFCKGKNITVFNFPYTDKDGDLMSKVINFAKHDWIAFAVASDIIDFSLIKEVNKLISSKNFTYNTIVVPFKNYILGLNLKGSPWYVPNGKRYFFRKSSLNFSNEVHYEIQFDTNSVLKLQCKGYVYHLTHQSVLSQNERHIRYTQREADIMVQKNISITRLRWGLIKLVISLLIKKNFLFKSNDVFALNIAFIAYHIHRFLFTWEKNKSIEDEYAQIRRNILRDIKDIETENDC